MASLLWEYLRPAPPPKFPDPPRNPLAYCSHTEALAQSTHVSLPSSNPILDPDDIQPSMASLLLYSSFFLLHSSR
jgi:hypothetical protein